MNSLYGKFGQKFMDKENMISIHTPYEELQQYKTLERVGDFFRVTEDHEPAPFCIPAWAAYVTSHARIKLHKAMEQCHPVYVDTDSMITNKKMIAGTGLGELELEYTIKDGVFVKPKFYAFTTPQGKEVVKLKGFGRRLSMKEFHDLLENPIAIFNKFVKFKESLRRNLLPNQVIEVKKRFSLEDDKRSWKHEFDKDVFHPSIARKVYDEEYKTINMTERYSHHEAHRLRLSAEHT